MPTVATSAHTIDFPYGQRVEIIAEDRLVLTHYGARTMPSRREVTPENLLEAEAEGYPGTADGIWRAMVEHECLHPWLAAQLWACPSYVVRHESGAEPTPYATRLYEEALVLSFQRFKNTDEITLPLEPFGLSLLYALRERFRAEYGWVTA